MARYQDLGGVAHHVMFAGPPDRPNKKMETTPEGFLICRDVKLARTGEQTYGSWEVPVIEPGPDGMVKAQRDEDEVFHPDAIASFDGKPFTNDHPVEDVTPANFRKYSVGTVMNPRRGTGEDSHCLVADIIVYDQKAIQDIRSGKRHVSAGYDADYQRLGPGRGRQVNIRGNHVSLVPEGRCGPLCSISDRSVKVTRDKNWKATFADKLVSVFKGGGTEEEMTRGVLDAVDSLPDLTQAAPARDAGHGHGEDRNITINLNRHRDDDGDGDTPPPPPPGDDVEGPLTLEQVQKAVEDVVAPIAETVSSLASRMDAIESAIEDVSDPTDTQTQDAVARAVVLMPDFKLPTFDAKPGSRAQRDAILSMKREVLTQALSSRDSADFVRPYLRSTRPDFKAMPAGEVETLFIASSQAARDANRANVGGLASILAPRERSRDSEPRKPMTVQDMQAANREFWDKKKA